jgi:Tfp pilus assembly protein PilF
VRPRLAGTPLPLVAAIAAIAIAAIAGWAEWQPLRSDDATNAGAIALGDAVDAENVGQMPLANREYAVARADLLAAISRDPLDITPLGQLGAVYAARGENRLAQATFDREVALQPSNTQSWQDLAYYESGLNTTAGKRAAYNAFAVALYLDPQNLPLKQAFLSLTPSS